MTRPVRGGRRWRRAGAGFGLALALLNAVAWQHAWQFTHFAATGKPRTPDPEHLSLLQRQMLLVTGITLPRPQACVAPSGYRALRLPLPGGAWLGAWAAPAAGGAPTRGTVVLLHGYGGEKSSLLPEAAFFRQLGYRCCSLIFAVGAARRATT